MGSGKWDSRSYASSSTDRVRRGVSDFDYSDRVKTGRAHGIHELLDPRKLKDGKRESRDSIEHPNSIPVMIFFDVTGSMGRIPAVMAKKLERLMDVILEQGIADPQVLVGAVGDATCDQYPFQVGQFESDNKFDDQLRQIILEGGGGAQKFESYGLPYYFAANHTVTDAWEKRGKKGYLFTIGDEMSWNLEPHEIQSVFDIPGGQETQKMGDLIKQAGEKWEIFHLRALDGSYREDPQIYNYWRELLGERLIPVEDSSYICEVIAGLVLSMETSLGYRHVIDKLNVEGRGAATVENALVTVNR